MRLRRGIGRAAPGHRIRGLALAGLLACCGALAALPAAAFEPLAGSKNFTAPHSVPDYFSNEAAPFRRGSQTATQGGDRFNTAPGTAPGTAPSVIGSAHAATIQPAPRAASGSGRATRRTRLTHSRLAHGRAGRHAASSRPRSAHVRRARATSRPAVATRHRAAASRSRYAVHGGRNAHRVFR